MSGQAAHEDRAPRRDDAARLSDDIGDVLGAIRRLIAEDEAQKRGAVPSPFTTASGGDGLAWRHGGNAALARQLAGRPDAPGIPEASAEPAQAQAPGPVAADPAAAAAAPARAAVLRLGVAQRVAPPPADAGIGARLQVPWRPWSPASAPAPRAAIPVATGPDDRDFDGSRMTPRALADALADADRPSTTTLDGGTGPALAAIRDRAPLAERLSRGIRRSTAVPQAAARRGEATAEPDADTDADTDTDAGTAIQRHNLRRRDPAPTRADRFAAHLDAADDAEPWDDDRPGAASGEGVARIGRDPDASAPARAPAAGRGVLQGDNLGARLGATRARDPWACLPAAAPAIASAMLSEGASLHGNPRGLAPADTFDASDGRERHADTGGRASRGGSAADRPAPHMPAPMAEGSGNVEAQVISASAAAPADDEVVETVIRDTIRAIIREELQGELGHRFSRNLRATIRREIALALEEQLPPV